MILMTGMWLLMPTTCLEGTGEKTGGGIAIYIKIGRECELSLKNGHKQVEGLWVRVRDQGNKKSLVAGVYYRPPDKVEPVDELFFL